MKMFQIALGTAILTTISGYVAFDYWNEAKKASQLQVARAIAASCDLPPLRVRIRSETRSTENAIALIGFYRDPKTNEKDSRVTCFEQAMKFRKLSFSDELSHAQFDPGMTVQ